MDDVSRVFTISQAIVRRAFANLAGRGLAKKTWGGLRLSGSVPGGEMIPSGLCATYHPALAAWLACWALRILTNSILIGPSDRATPHHRDMVRHCAWGEISRIITDCGPEGWQPDLAQDRLVIAGML